MLRAVVLCRDEGLLGELNSAVLSSGLLVVLRRLDHYPGREAFDNFAHAHRPQVALLDLACLEEVLEAGPLLGENLAGAVPLVVHWTSDNTLLRRLMQAGVREMLNPPFHSGAVGEVLARVEMEARGRTQAEENGAVLYAFLPAKGGDGASTLAVNVALAVARDPEMRALLLDFDLQGSMPRFLLKLSNPFHTRSALERAGELDDGLWRELIAERGNLHVLAAGEIVVRRPPEATRAVRLIDFCRPRYSVICADLGGVDEVALEVMNRAHRIYLVMAAELASAFHAREKLRFLESVELGDRVEVLLNRWHKQAPLKTAALEQVLGYPVELTLPADADAVHKAVMAGAAVEPGSELGRGLAALARRMRTPKPEAPPRRRGVEHFAVVPARYSLLRP